MAAIKHTLMREDLSTVNARQFSATRDEQTILIALDAIGSLHRTLLLTDEEDGVWMINSDITIPANVLLHIPLGVTLLGPGDVTILGGLWAFRTAVHLGPGVLIQDQAVLGLNLAFLRVDHLVGGDGYFERRLGVRDQFFVTADISEVEWPVAPDLPPAIGQQNNVSVWSHYYSTTELEYMDGTGLGSVVTFTANTGSVGRAVVAFQVVEPNGFHGTGPFFDALNPAVWVVGTGGGTVDHIICIHCGIGQFSDALVGEAVGIRIDSIYDPNKTIGAITKWASIQIPDSDPLLNMATIYGIECSLTNQPSAFGLYFWGTAPNYLDGNTGIGGLPTSAKLFVNGTASKPGGSTWTDSASLAALKTNIRPLTNALAQLLALQGKQWEWAPDQGELLALLPGTRVGFVIEEVEPVRPTWVTGLDGERKGLTISGFEALTVEALRELVQRVAALEAAAAGA